jgi:large subunit ribosomal protein L13
MGAENSTTEFLRNKVEVPLSKLKLFCRCFIGKMNHHLHGALKMKTWNAKPDEVERKWWLVDASGMRVGRLATQIATLLRGKHKPEFTPHVDTGDFVVVINTNKIELSGTKWDDKTYYRHSRYFGSMKEKSAAQMKEEDSTFILSEAVRGMLPTNKLSRHLIQKMKTFKNGEHTHAAQKPVPFNTQSKKK